MLTENIAKAITAAMGFQPTAEQAAATGVFGKFITDRHDRVAMILRGAAGTGKTTLAGAIVRAMIAMRQKIMLMAPTGRAAKVFSLYAGNPAYTIHRSIYRQKIVGEAVPLFTLAENKRANTLFIVDEASMIANEGYGDSMFGGGHLLDDLIQYVYSGNNCRLMLIGDKAQLPPVGEEESPALTTPVIAAYGIGVYEADLREVLRQSKNSGILSNATTVRQIISADGGPVGLPKIDFRGYDDIRRVGGDELIEQLSTSYSEVGTDETMVVTRSNKRAIIYNNGIRGMVLGREEELCKGDMLMAVKNNYYWPEKQKLQLPFIANGDRMRVVRVRNIRELYGFRFADLQLELPDYDNMELTATAILDSLQSEAPALTKDESSMLYTNVMQDYLHIEQKGRRYREMRNDPYYNALQIKYAYAVTCHKAQGGQWEHIYVDQGYMTDDMLTNDYIHWLYTAFTRATRKLYLVNWPQTQTVGGDAQDIR